MSIRTNITTIAAGLSLFFSTLTAIYAHHEHVQAARIRIAACQMLPNRQLWDDFECTRAFKEAQ